MGDIKRNPDSEERKMTFPLQSFLKDVLICSLGAYGGPEAHMSVFLDQMVIKRKYLDEAEFIELIALCSILPGPTSTQTIVAIGHKMGGPLLALLTMLVWALPVLVVMTALSFLYQFLDLSGIPRNTLRYIGPMAVGFIIVAAWRIGLKVAKDTPTALLMFFSAVITYFIRDPWIFPLVLFAGGIAGAIVYREPGMWERPRLDPPWGYLVLFAAIAIGGATWSCLNELDVLCLFESFYRYGYLVFGGGQVVVPLMFSELVEVRHLMTGGEFLTGYGLVQGLPGPMFSFAAYAGGMAARGGSPLFQILGAVAGGVGIFLPGLLLIYFIYPVWEGFRKIRAVQVSLRGINAVAGGMIAIAAVIVMQASGFAVDNLAVVTISVGLLLSRKVPAPLIVIASIAAGILL